MKPTRLLTVAVLIAAALGMIPKTAAAGTFASSQGYQITVPSGWIAKASVNGPQTSTVVYTPPSRLKFPTISFLSRPQAGMTLELFKKATPYAMSEEFKGNFKPVATGNSIIGGVSAFEVEGTFLFEKHPVWVHSIVAITHGQFYMICGFYPDQNRRIYEATYASIVKTIRWTH